MVDMNNFPSSTFPSTYDQMMLSWLSAQGEGSGSFILTLSQNKRLQYSNDLSVVSAPIQADST
jgi:hypothetical protein